MKKVIWLTSTNEENWNCAEEYDCKESAIADAANYHALESDDDFYIGTRERFILTPSDGNSLVENILCGCEELGDFSENWQDSVMSDKEITAFANKKILELCNFIMKKRPPSFFVIGNVEHLSASVSIAILAKTE